METLLDPLEGKITNNGRKLADALAKECPEAWSWTGFQRACSLLSRHACTHNRIQEAWCSIEMSDQETKRVERQEASVERRITEIAKALGWKVKFTGDPRGYTVRVFTPSGRYNTWGGPEEGLGLGLG